MRDPTRRTEEFCNNTPLLFSKLSQVPGALRVAAGRNIYHSVSLRVANRRNLQVHLGQGADRGLTPKEGLVLKYCT